MKISTQYLALLAIALLTCSCSSSLYHHRTVRSNSDEQVVVKKQSPVQKRVQSLSQLNAVSLSYEPIVYNLPEGPPAFLPIEASPEESEVVAQEVRSHPAPSKMPAEPNATNADFAELLGAFILISFLSLAMGGIAALFGMYFWKAFAISFVLCFLLFMFAAE